MNHVMIDLETLGVTADAAILSIGAVLFDPMGRLGDRDSDTFYASISIESNLAAGRKVNEETMIWWMEQSPEARRVFTEPKMTLHEGLTSLYDWIASEVGPREMVEVWAKPAKFDVAMLEHAYGQFSMDTPWQHWASNCLTTLRKQAKRTFAVIPDQPRPEVAHNAIEDAKAQARHVIELNNLLRKGTAS